MSFKAFIKLIKISIYQVKCLLPLVFVSKLDKKSIILLIITNVIIFSPNMGQILFQFVLQFLASFYIFNFKKLNRIDWLLICLNFYR